MPEDTSKKSPYPGHSVHHSPESLEILSNQHQAVERFVQCFERSSKRWEIIVYPAMFAFVILAAYGFYLVYNLTHDMRHMTRSIDTMAVTMDDMSSKLNAMEPMLTRLTTMDQSIRMMTVASDRMRHDMTVMTSNVARPMGIMNSFLPW